MIPSAELAKIIARHARLVGDVSKLHMRAAKGNLIVLSGGKTGIVLRTRTKIDAEFTACVDGNTVAGIIKNHGPIDLSVKDARLHIKGGRLRADVPLVSAEIPQIPKAEDYKTLSSKEVASLKQAIARTSIREGGPDAQLTLVGNGKELSVAFYDNYYGAFYELPAKTKMSLGFLPQDVPLVAGALGESETKIAQIGMQLLIVTPGETFLVPSTTPSPVPLATVDEGSRLAAKFDVAALKLTLDSMGALLKSKEANTISVTLSEGITLSVTSDAGSMKKRLDAEVKEKAQFAINYRFLSDIVSLCAGDDARLYVYRGDDKSVTRIQVRSGGVHYVAVTSV